MWPEFDWYFQHEHRWRELENVFRTFGALTDNARAPGNTWISVRSALQRAGMADVESVEDAYQLVFQDDEEWWDSRNGTSRGVGSRRPRSAARQTSTGLAGLIVYVTALTAGVVLALNQLTTPSWFCLALGALAAGSLLFRR